jgi:hypothetical protein
MSLMEAGARQRPEQHLKRNPLAFSAMVGFFAGIWFGAVRSLAYALHFTKVPPAFLADPWLPRRQLAGMFWGWAGYGLFILMSVLAALLYWMVLGRLRGPWPGLLFGAAWWLLLFAGGPWIGLVVPPNRLGWNSLCTEACLYVLWGLFIGYSIAFEFHDEKRREPGSLPGQGKPGPS